MLPLTSGRRILHTLPPLPSPPHWSVTVFGVPRQKVPAPQCFVSACCGPLVCLTPGCSDQIPFCWVFTSGSLSLWRPCSEIRSYHEGVGVRTSTGFVRSHSSTDNSHTLSILVHYWVQYDVTLSEVRSVHNSLCAMVTDMNCCTQFRFQLPFLRLGLDSWTHLHIFFRFFQLWCTSLFYWHVKVMALRILLPHLFFNFLTFIFTLCVWLSCLHLCLWTTCV